MQADKCPSLWLHAAILDLFRPFLQYTSKNTRLTTFSYSDNTPQAVFKASTTRLKSLIISYRLNFASSTFTILWHSALTYAATALFQHTEDENWYSYFLLCLYGYERLSHSWRVARAILKGLLSMSLRKTSIPSDTVLRLLYDLENSHPKLDSDEIRAPFVLDLDSDQEYSDSASVEQLANQLEEGIMFQDFTNVFAEELN